VLRTGNPQKNIELIVERPDGSRVPVIANFATLRDAGKIVGAVTAFDDITERKRAEEALKEADRKKDQFLAVLAHELRNPLVPIRNGLQILKLDGHNEALAERARSVMDQALNHMVHLIDDLLDVSRITTGKLKLRPERVELNSVVQSALDTAQPVIDEQRQELSVRLPATPILIDADPTRLAQVLANLLNNAAKYSEPGGKITLTVEAHDDQVTIRLADNGIGIPADQLPRIFEPFAQVEDTLELSRGGLGIGLSLVKGLVEMHGGTVDAHSNGSGRGSEFVVHLPIAGAETAPHPAVTEARQDSSDKQYRILVVDDNQLSCKSTAMFLAMMGHELATARDGLEGIERARAFQPNVILLDIGLPQLNGYDTARRIREQPWGKNILLIAVTGYGQEEDRRRSVEAGFDHHIVKPLNIVELEKKLSELDQG
jgi:signal transduction histidine kinase/ActR/RegA family two-component response regulator